MKGAILLTHVKSGRKKYFAVTAVADTECNRAYHRHSIGVNHIRTTTDAKISQKEAEGLEQFSDKGLTLPMNWRYKEGKLSV